MFSLFRHGVQVHSAITRSYVASHVRTYATLPPTSLKPTHSIYVSNSTNPYFNLTFEDWLFRFHSPSAPLLFLYRNSPCVVIGRNQNPWKEVNLAASEKSGIPWIRRRSGGGTVYHDLGNTNYSIHVPRPTFDRRATANVVVRAVRALGVDAYANERNDICVAGEKIRSAYKIVRNRAYHHGTMLISTRLDTLGDLLRTNKVSMKTKGVASVRSPVRNLVQSSVSATHEGFVEAVIRSFREEYTIEEEPCLVHETTQYLEDEYFKGGMSELQNWDWAYGQTPEFEYVVSGTFKWGHLTSTIHSRHGIILSCSLSFPHDTRIPPSTREWAIGLSQRLVGERYGFVDGGVIKDDTDDGSEVVKEIWSWLKREMQV